jgi:predicted transcriptional regulator
MNIEAIAKYFEMLGKPLSLRIIEILLKHDEMSLREIQEIDISMLKGDCEVDRLISEEKSVSLRLKQLENVGIVIHRDAAPGGHHKFYYRLVAPESICKVLQTGEKAMNAHEMCV